MFPRGDNLPCRNVKNVILIYSPYQKNLLESDVGSFLKTNVNKIVFGFLLMTTTRNFSAYLVLFRPVIRP